MPSDDLRLYLGQQGINDYYFLNEFKDKTVQYKSETYFKMFDSAIQQGLTNIIFETSFIDKNQIYDLLTIIESVMETYPDKQLTITILSYKKLPITTKLLNISINFII